MMKRRLLILTLMMTACGSSAPTSSQQTQGLSASPAPNVAAENKFALPLAQTLPLMDAARSVLFPPAATQTKSSSGAATATFQPGKERIVPRLFAKSISASQDKQAKYEEEFAGYLQSYEERIKQRGGRQYDLARAAGFFIAATYYAASGGIELSQSQADALRLQLESAAPASSAFQIMSESEKQRMYETFVALGQYFAVNYEMVAQSDHPKDKDRLRELARQHLTRLIGVSDDRLRFTERGIEF